MMRPSASRHTRAFADVLTGTAAAALVFVAVPYVLIVFVGVPLPRHWTHADVVSPRGLFDLLTVLAWVAWLACCRQLLRSIWKRQRAEPVTRMAPVARRRRAGHRATLSPRGASSA